MRRILDIVCCSLWLGCPLVAGPEAQPADTGSPTSESVRKRYAELYSRAHSLLRQLRELKLSAAHMLSEPDTGPAERRLAHMIERRQRRTKELEALHQDLESFRQYLEATLGTLEASDKLRKTVLSRYQRLLKTSEKLARPSPPVAERGDGGNGARQCRVLAVAPELQIVALEVGTAQGAYPGMLWQISHGEHSPVQLKLVQTRRTLSAAVVVRGKIKTVDKGDMARLLDTGGPAAKPQLRPDQEQSQ